MKDGFCIWHCGRRTRNRSRICDGCWRDRDAIYQARKRREAAAEKRPLTDKQRAALTKANAKRMAKLTQQTPATGLSDSKGKVLPLTLNQTI